MLTPAVEEFAPETRSRTPSWTARRIDSMLNDLRDNIRRVSLTNQTSINLHKPSTSSNLLSVEEEIPKRKMTSEREEDAKEAETLRLILEANHHHAQYVALMDQALPIIQKLKAAKDGGFFTSLWAIIKGASSKTDRVKQLMQRAESEADKMKRKWDKAEKLASGLRNGKYLEMLDESRRKAARQNARIDGRMTDLRRLD